MRRRIDPLTLTMRAAYGGVRTSAAPGAPGLAAPGLPAPEPPDTRVEIVVAGAQAEDMHTTASDPDTNVPATDTGASDAGTARSDMAGTTGASATTGRSSGSPRLGRIALVVAVVAAAGSVACAAIVGAAVGPAEVALGPRLVDLPGALFWTIAGLLASQLFWLGLGLASIVMGVVSLVRGHGSRAAVGGIVLAVAFPLLSLFVLVLLMLATSPL